MAKLCRVERVAKLKQSLRKMKAIHAAGFEKGLKKAGLFVQRESQMLVPIDTGVLRNSAGTRSEGHSFQTVVIVFYTASYAPYVHENLVAMHAAGTEAKFLEKAVTRNYATILKIVRNEAVSL